MKIVADEIGVTFGGDVYDITWKQIEEDGLHHWLPILIGKRWFTKDVEQQFITEVIAHTNENAQQVRLRGSDNPALEFRPMGARVTSLVKQIG